MFTVVESRDAIDVAVKMDTVLHVPEAPIGGSEPSDRDQHS